MAGPKYQGLYLCSAGSVLVQGRAHTCERSPVLLPRTYTPTQPAPPAHKHLNLSEVSSFMKIAFFNQSCCQCLIYFLQRIRRCDYKNWELKLLVQLLSEFEIFCLYPPLTPAQGQASMCTVLQICLLRQMASAAQSHTPQTPFFSLHHCCPPAHQLET